MEAVFYFFGIKRKEKTFAINDPIRIEDCNPYNLNEQELRGILKKNKLRLKDYLSEIILRRGLLFGATTKSEKITQFLELGSFLTPSIIEKSFTIYFLDNKKLIMFKIERKFRELKEIKEEIYRILKPLNLFSKSEFINLTKKWKDGKCSDDEIFYLEKEEFKLCLGNFYSSFIIIKPRAYKKLKKIARKKYKTLLH